MSKRHDKNVFLMTAESHLGRWYLWGGDNPEGFDCSGLVVECLRSIGYLNTDRTAHDLWILFKSKEITYCKAGCLVFYFNQGSHVYHVGIAISDMYYITADGGDSKIKTISDAMKADAFIKVRPIDGRKGERRYVYLF